MAGDAPPGAADAARLVLGFGRLVERVAVAGFEPELAGVDDFAVGPGPTPFLERPLLPLPGADPEAPTGGGQRMLSRLLDALMARRDIPDGLLAWAERAATAGFGSLGECLDDLERAGTEAADGERCRASRTERDLRRRRTRRHGTRREP